MLEVERFTWLFQKKVYLYRGFSTVWYNHFTGRKAGNFTEEKLCNITYSLQWEEKMNFCKEHFDAGKTKIV